MLNVLKVGGSVLRDAGSYARVAACLAERLAAAPAERLVIIVSAQYGVTDALLADARAISGEPDPAALDLLWSTGETRSVALLTLHLQRLNVGVTGLNAHQTGLSVPDAALPGVVDVRPLHLLSALGRARIVVVPGFFAIRAGGGIASLGRGGSDLTAVLLASALRADACELVKDVPGYFTADPHVHADAAPIHELTIDAALEMAAAGCDLVQAAALHAAQRTRLPILVRSLDSAAHVTRLLPRSAAHGVRHQDDSRRTAVGA